MLTVSAAAARVRRGGERSESDPCFSCGFFLGGDRSESDPLLPWAVFLGGELESHLVLGRLRAGDRSGTRPAEEDLDIALCGESVK